MELKKDTLGTAGLVVYDTTRALSGEGSWREEKALMMQMRDLVEEFWYPDKRSCVVSIIVRICFQS